MYSLLTVACRFSERKYYTTRLCNYVTVCKYPRQGVPNILGFLAWGARYPTSQMGVPVFLKGCYSFPRKIRMGVSDSGGVVNCNIICAIVVALACLLTSFLVILMV